MTPRLMGVEAVGSKVFRRSLIAAAVLCALPAVQASASTIETFTWVSNSSSGTDPVSGTLVLTLPGTVTGPQFSVNAGTAAAEFADITTLKYAFSSGLVVNLGNITSDSFSSTSWTTTTVTSRTTGGTAVGTTDLITGFNFGGPNNLKLSETQGSATNIALANNLINPATGGVANDTGYWELTSSTVVPLPASAWLLLSGVLGMGGLIRSRRSV